MNNRCTVCNHSRAHDINLALLAGTTLDTLKQQFGLSRSALHRHKLHLQRTIDQAEDRLRNNFILSYLFQLNDYNAAAAATVAAARSEGDARLTLQAANAGARIINTMARFGVDLDHETIYRLITSREYVQPGCLLPGDPQILAGPRQNLVRSLAAACPEIAPDALFAPEDVAAYLKLAQEPDANTCLPEARQPEFPGFLIPLADVLPAASDPRSAAGDQQPKEMRDRCGTDAGQTSPATEIIIENQADSPGEKNLPKHPSLRRESGTPPAALEGHFPPDPLETALPKPKPPPPYDATARRADELFLMTHGYPRNNPPKPIPNHRREEDFRSSSIFGDLRKYF